MITDAIADVAVGQRPGMLAESVTLATPLTVSRLDGRDRVATVLRQIATAFGIGAPEFVAQDAGHDVVTFTGTADGHEIGVLAVLNRADSGGYGAVDLYARPWPYVAIVRARLAAGDDLFRDDVDLSSPYAPSGPGARYLDSAPVLPGLALDVAFHSPVLTCTASGRDLVAVVLKAVEETYGPPRYHWAFQAGDSLVALYDGSVHGHAFQVAAVITLNKAGEIADMRIYSRPWPVTALFRGEVYKLLRGTLGPEFWQGPAPLAALGEQ